MRFLILGFFYTVQIVLRHSDALELASICISASDCCSFSSRTMTTYRQISCCGAAMDGLDAVTCSRNGRCQRGTVPCKSSMDDPLCNIATNEDSERGWRRCRQESVKMNSLYNHQVYGGNAIHMAAFNGRSDSVQWILNEQIGSNILGYGGATPLHMAALTPDGTQMMQLLLSNGADPNAIDAFGFTPLHRVIQSGNIEGATLLLSNGANVTQVAPGDESPLHLAAYENARTLAQLLLAFGADPFARNDRGVMSFEVGLFDMSVPPHHMG